MIKGGDAVTEGILALLIIGGMSFLCVIGGIISKIRGDDFIDGAMMTLVGIGVIGFFILVIYGISSTWHTPIK